MTDKRLTHAAQCLDAGWNSERHTRVLLALQSRRQRARRVTRIGLLVAGLATAVVATGVLFQSLREPMASAKLSTLTLASATPIPIEFGDGSQALVLDQVGRLIVTHASMESVSLRLEEGRADFRVVSNPRRTFEVQCGTVRVVVVGTRFTVERLARERAQVSVVRGQVAVHWGDGSKRILRSGESSVFPPAESASPVGSGAFGIDSGKATAAPTGPDRVGPDRAGPPNESRTDWRVWTRQGNYAEAHAALEREPHLVRDSAQDLLLAADAARLSGHPARAVSHLEKLLKQHSKDRQAPLAAFTLGRLRLQLGEPARAAEAFWLSRTLAPTSALSEDALAREADALAKSGDRARAATRANEYLERFPSGARAGQMRKLINADSD